MKPATAQASVITQIAVTRQMTVVEMKAKWETIFGTVAPNHDLDVTLNILLSFAQFERRLSASATRSRPRTSAACGYVPMGYDVRERKLGGRDDQDDLRALRRPATTLAKALVTEGVHNKRDKPIDKGFLYKLLNSRVYLGEAVHKGSTRPSSTTICGTRCTASFRKVPGSGGDGRQTPALLKGIIFTKTGAAMTATKKGTHLYRASMDLIRDGGCGWSAGMVEDGVALAHAPRTRPERSRLSERQARPSMNRRSSRRYDRLWGAAQPNRRGIVHLLVDGRRGGHCRRSCAMREWNRFCET